MGLFRRHFTRIEVPRRPADWPLSPAGLRYCSRRRLRRLCRRHAERRGRGPSECRGAARRPSMAVQNKSNVPIGTVLEGKFRVTREIGRGGMAAVYEAENIDIGKRVAVKILAAELITSRVVRERFIREARAASAVRSPHICDVYDSGMYEERPFLVMELLEGESLYDMLTRVRRLDIETTRDRDRTQTARGLAQGARSEHRPPRSEAREHFRHKDEEGGLCAKLLDFGLAKFYEPTNDGDPKTVRLTREGALFGTPAYMSPEQAKGQGEVDHRSDLWALGCIVYECLTGQTVWSVDQGVAMILAQVAGAPLPRPSRLRPDLPPEFEAWFLKALERDQSKRYQNARELADALEAAFSMGNTGAQTFRSRRREPSLHTDLEATSLDELIATRACGEHRGERRGRAGRRGDDAEARARTTARRAVSARSRSRRFLRSVATRRGSIGCTRRVRPARPCALAKGGVKSAGVRSGEIQGESRRSTPIRSRTPSRSTRRSRCSARTRRRRSRRFKEAYAMSSAAPARSLLSHATVAVEEAAPKGCKVTAIARPAPVFDRTSRVRPSARSHGRGGAAHLGRQPRRSEAPPGLRRAARRSAQAPRSSARRDAGSDERRRFRHARAGLTRRARLRRRRRQGVGCLRAPARRGRPHREPGAPYFFVEAGRFRGFARGGRRRRVLGRVDRATRVRDHRSRRAAAHRDARAERRAGAPERVHPGEGTHEACDDARSRRGSRRARDRVFARAAGATPASDAPQRSARSARQGTADAETRQAATAAEERHDARHAAQRGVGRRAKSRAEHRVHARGLPRRLGRGAGKARSSHFSRTAARNRSGIASSRRRAAARRSTETRRAAPSRGSRRRAFASPRSDATDSARRTS